MEFDGSFLRYVEAVASAFLAVGAGHAPLVLLLENAEDADACAVAILQRLVREATGHHIQIVLTTRGSAPEPFLESGASELPLEPLGIDSVETLLSTSIAGVLRNQSGLAKELHETSGGFPLATWAALQIWLKDGLLAQDHEGVWFRDRSKNAESEIGALLSYRISRLTSEEREVAVLAAVREGAVEFTWLSDVANAEPEALRRALEGLLRSGLLVSTGAGAFRYWHAEAKHAILEHAGEDELRGAHQRVVGWLEDRPTASKAQLAYHAELGGVSSTDLPILHLQAAQELLEVYESSAAYWHLERALAGELRRLIELSRSKPRATPSCWVVTRTRPRSCISERCLPRRAISWR